MHAMQQDMGRNKIKNIGDTMQLLRSVDLCIVRQVQEERSVMSRNDVLYSCQSCMQSVNKQTRQTQGTNELQEQIIDLKQAIENKFEIAIQKGVYSASRWPS